MASSRSVIEPGTVKRTYKRRTKPSEAEKALVAQVVMDQPAEVTPTQVNALARSLKRTPAQIKVMVAEARENFVASAGDYVDIHKQATQAALANGREGDSKALDVAVKASQWAIQNISAEGARVVDKASTEPMGQRVFIGINVGNVDASKPPVVTVVPE